MTIIRDRKTKEVTLLCNAVRCSEHETFPPDTRWEKIIRKWIPANGWKTHYTSDRWTHSCPDCERRRQAPDAYFDRLQA